MIEKNELRVRVVNTKWKEFSHLLEIYALFCVLQSAHNISKICYLY